MILHADHYFKKEHLFSNSCLPCYTWILQLRKCIFSILWSLVWSPITTICRHYMCCIQELITGENICANIFIDMYQQLINSRQVVISVPDLSILLFRQWAFFLSSYLSPLTYHWLIIFLNTVYMWFCKSIL